MHSLHKGWGSGGWCGKKDQVGRGLCVPCASAVGSRGGLAVGSKSRVRTGRARGDGWVAGCWAPRA
eukprot:140908-Alexandrium_andersonii.AAC.1